MTKLEEALQYDDRRYTRHPFGIIVDQEFNNLQGMLMFMLAEERRNYLGDRQNEPVVPPGIKDLLMDTSEPDGYMSLRMRTRKFRDSSLGGNEAINCYPQFGRDDDIILPINAIDRLNKGKINPDPKKGMGRVYSEIIDDQQQILYMSFGVPEFSNPVDFFSDHIDAALARIMNTGDMKEGGIGRLLGYGVGVIIALPFMPIKWLGDAITSLSSTKINKYYDFRSTMHLYYRGVNTMMIHTAVNLGIANGTQAPSMDADNGLFSEVTTGSLLRSGEGEFIEQSHENPGASDTFQKYGYDIYRILCKRHEYQTGKPIAQNVSTDNWIDSLVGKVYEAGSHFITAADTTTQEATLYVGFRIEKTTDTSESLSNSTTESKLAGIINARVQEGRERSFMLGEWGDGKIESVLAALAGGVTGVIAGAADMLGISGAVNESLQGNAVTDIPEIYSGSSFSKSYSFNMKLFSPYGDSHSIFQRIYVPFFMILAGAFPRATGKNSYTSPFHCRCYSRGMVAIPCGIIDSLSITKGSDQFGWNNNHLPLQINLSFSIKDLSPAMYIAIAADGSTGIEIFGQNSTYQEYLLTLSGMGLKERLLFSKNFKRKIAVIMNNIHASYLNPYYWGMEAGTSTVGQIFGALRPTSGLSNQ